MRGGTLGLLWNVASTDSNWKCANLVCWRSGVQIPDRSNLNLVANNERHFNDLQEVCCLGAFSASAPITHSHYSLAFKQCRKRMVCFMSKTPTVITLFSLVVVLMLTEHDSTVLVC